MAADDAKTLDQQPKMADSHRASEVMPQNVSELLTRAQLDNARDEFLLIKSRSELNPSQDRELAVKIVRKLAEYHREVISKYIEEADASSVVSWTADLTRLDTAMQLLEEVELSDD